MYYHVIITLNDIKKDSLGHLDIEDKDLIYNDYFLPYLKKETFFIDGKMLSYDDINTIKVFESSANSTALTGYYNNKKTEFIVLGITTYNIVQFNEFSTNITEKIYKEAQNQFKRLFPVDSMEIVIKPTNTSKVFVVHGHNEAIKANTKNLLLQLQLEPIILSEQANGGKTVIEKLEEYTDVGFGIVLYTACDVGAVKAGKDNLKARARQNVVLEHGYLMGKIGRENVCALVEEDVETPSDISGVVYIPIDKHEAWKTRVAKELKQAGYDIDMNLLLR